MVGGKKTSQRRICSPIKKITHPEQMEELNSSRLLCIYGDENTVLSREDQCSTLSILSWKNHFCLGAMNNNLKQAFRNLSWSLFFFPFFLFLLFFVLLICKDCLRD